MTLTINVAPETEKMLESQARRAGVPLETYAAGLLQEKAEREEADAALRAAEELSYDEWLARFNNRTLYYGPVVPLEHLRRENMYSD
jgi:hypothetical protein